MKSIKDYLHLYLGCEAAIGYDRILKSGMRIDEIVDVGLHGAFTSNSDLEKFEDIQPILRPLSDITKAELNEFNKLYETLFSMADGVNEIMQQAACTKYLLSKHFDLFNLIPEGLAIDATTLTPKL